MLFCSPRGRFEASSTKSVSYVFLMCPYVSSRPQQSAPSSQEDVS